MVRLIFWHVRVTENRPLSSLELFVYSQPVVLLQGREVLWNGDEASPLLSMQAAFRVDTHSLGETEDWALPSVTSTLIPDFHAALGAVTSQFSPCTSELSHQYLGNIRKGRWDVDNDSLLLLMRKGHGADD